jgi:hypothetical protein
MNQSNNPSKHKIMKPYLHFESNLNKVLILIYILFPNTLISQDCTNLVTLNLININGGVFQNQSVVFSNKSKDLEYKQISNSEGKVIIDLPCDQTFTITISNYTREMEISTSTYNGATYGRNVAYEPDMAQKDILFSMNDLQKKELDAIIYKLKDTTLFKGSVMRTPIDIANYSLLTVALKNIEGNPLNGEIVTMTGQARHKSFRGKTDQHGKVTFYLPKGDKYHVNFLYTKDYAKYEVKYSKGIGTAKLDLSYLGTFEIKRRRMIELERIRVEEARLKKIHDDFLAWCKTKGVTEEEGHKLKLKMEAESFGYNNVNDTVVTAVLNRNNWTEKLIVCDLTGSMTPYASQLSLWYLLNQKLEKNLQFVFFNDGDSKSDGEKIIGETGGIYYKQSTTFDDLIDLMANVQNAGNGGDCPENNMEALIKGVKTANPYKELIMIVDNNAPVKDITLLKDFNTPVHIILCGSKNGYILKDYLRIAWKTKGSIHTMEQDLTRIALLSEGQTITIGNNSYKIMGGEFINVTK